MSEGLNKVQVIGNLGADPELRFTQGGQGVLNLRLAASTSYLDKDGKRQERTEWVSVVIWGKRGEGLNKCLEKGSRIYVEGELRTSSYEKDGDKRYKTEVVASNVLLLDGKPGGRSRDDDDDRGRDDRGRGRDDDRGRDDRRDTRGREDDRGRRDDAPRGRDDRGRGRDERPRDDRRERSRDEGSKGGREAGGDGRDDDDIPF